MTSPEDGGRQGDPDRSGQRVLGRFRLDARIGRGGVGEVYRATDESTGQCVAVKVMREDLLRVRTAAARFLREARIAQTLSHPAVPRGLDAGVDASGTPVLVMEYVDGEDFAAILASRQRLEIRDALATGARAADALAHAHAMGIVHRDVKPANLMLRAGAAIPDGVVVLDFGLAFVLDEPRLSATHGFVGSLEYMAPEQAKGDVVSSASDIYSLGATLAHLLTGATLYDGGYLQQIAGHTRQPVPSLRARRPDLPRIVEHYLTSMLDKDPARRPSSAREVADALAELAGLDRAEAPRAPALAAVVVTAPPSASVPPPPVAAGGGASGSASGRARDALIEELHARSSQLHQVTRACAAAHGRMVQEIVEIAARRMERDLLAREARAHERAGNGAAADEAWRKLGTLGDPEADRKREAALEAAAAAMLRRAREDEAEILTEIQALQARLVEGG